MVTKRNKWVIPLVGIGLLSGCGTSAEMLAGAARDSVETAIQDGVQTAIEGVVDQALDPILDGLGDIVPF